MNKERNNLNQLKVWARKLKLELYVLYFAYKDQRTPWYAKLFAALVVAYAFSPIDLIPDFIPILGYLDDVILVPLGIMVAIKLMPQSVIEENRLKAEELMKKGKPKNWISGSIIILIWLVLLIAIIMIFL